MTKADSTDQPNLPSLTSAGPPPRVVTIALLGNPNTGKTTLFNALAGMRQRVGNYPGVTVETKKGQMSHNGSLFNLVDLPGTYSLAPRSPDEMVTVDLILGQQPGEAQPNVIVAIVDAANLERNLYLTTQAMELGVPVVIALNMIDVAEKQGLRLDPERLSKQLGVAVVPIQANKGMGLDRLKEAIYQKATEEPASGKRQVALPWPEAFEREAVTVHEGLGDGVPPFLIRRLLLDVGGHAERTLTARHGMHVGTLVKVARQRLAEAGYPVPAVEARTRYSWIRQAMAGCVERPQQHPVTWTDRLDRVLTHKIWGTAIFLLLMAVVFTSIFYVAQWPMDLIKEGKKALAGLFSGWHGPLASLLVDGVLEGVGSILVFLPQILILFGFIAFLEDCGYMARAAYLMDKFMSRCGLSGQSFIPMLSSMACAVPGIMATRVIENRHDRLATILVAPLMSCSARLPVYTLLIAAFIPTNTVLGYFLPGLVMFTMYLVGLVVAPVVALLLKRTLLRGRTPGFIMEMPLYKCPSLITVLRRMFDSGWAFIRQAGTLILASMILVWALLYFPYKDETGTSYELRIAQAKDQADINALHGDWKRHSLLGRMGRAIEPAVKPLGWDWRIGMAVLASFPAREVVVGTLGVVYNLGERRGRPSRSTRQSSEGCNLG